jgi:hypothetical protein
MKAKCLKKGIVVSQIFNESMLDDVDYMAEKAGCKMAAQDMGGTEYLITGTTEQLNTFIKLWNS